MVAPPSTEGNNYPRNTPNPAPRDQETGPDADPYQIAQTSPPVRRAALCASFHDRNRTPSMPDTAQRLNPRLVIASPQISHTTHPGPLSAHLCPQVMRPPPRSRAPIHTRTPNRSSASHTPRRKRQNEPTTTTDECAPDPAPRSHHDPRTNHSGPQPWPRYRMGSAPRS